MPLVQSKSGGSATGSGSAPFTLASTAAAFDNPTVAGNFILLVAWGKFVTTGVASVAGSLTPVTSGFSWVQLGATQWFTANPGTFGVVAIYHIDNAAAMNTTTVVTLANGGSASVSSASVEFDLYEFSGVVPISPLDQGRNQNNNTGSATTPTTPNLTTTATDLIISAFSGFPGSNISAGSGYSLGINAAVATIGQLQYQLSVASGSIPTAFNGTETYWSCVAGSFKLLAPVPPTVTSVSPNSGPTTGGTPVTIAGTDFLAGTTVMFGIAPATSVVIGSTTSLTCVTPPNAAGSVTVSVTNTDGTGNLPNGYTYIQAGGGGAGSGFVSANTGRCSGVNMPNINSATSVQYVMDQCKLHTKLQNFFGVGQITGEPGCGIATRVNQMLLQRRMAWKFNRVELGPQNTACGNFFVTQQGFQDIRHAGACIFALLNNQGGGGTLPSGGVSIDLAPGIVINNQTFNPINGGTAGLSITGDGGGGATGFAIANGGAGYTQGDLITLIQAGGFGCVFTVGGVDGSGAVLAISTTPSTDGQGYHVANGLATSGGTGTGCTVNLLSVTPFVASTITVQTLDPHPFQTGNIGQTTLYISGAKNPAFNSVFTWNQLIQQSLWTQGYMLTGIPDNQHLQLASSAQQVSGTISAISSANGVITLTVPNYMSSGDILIPTGLTVNPALNGAPVTLLSATATAVRFASTAMITAGSETGTLVAADSGAAGIFNLGWIESASIQDINSTAFPQPVKPIDAVHRMAPEYTTTGDVISVCALVDYNNGVIKFRLSQPMGTYAFQINIIYQARAPKLATAQSVFQWPDDLSYVLVEMCLWQASRFAYGVAGEETIKLEQSAQAALMSALESEDKEANIQAITPEFSLMR